MYLIGRGFRVQGSGLIAVENAEIYRRKRARENKIESRILPSSGGGCDEEEEEGDDKD